MTRNVLIFLVLIAASFTSWMEYRQTPSPDLLATWMAGKYFAEGVLSQIYPAEITIFTMRPPSDWVPFLRSTGYDEAVYPFIYPPLWAWVGSFLHQIASFETVSSVASFINPMLLGATIWLAARMSAQTINEIFFVGITVILFVTSLTALVALEQNQPQIVVGFLMVLGVERTRAGSPIAGGVAMAIAASLKLYPVFFALFWWAQGERKAATAFTLVGGAIGILSIAVAGWPLHMTFLHQVGAISQSVLVTFFTFSIDPTIATLFTPDQLLFVENPRILKPDEVEGGWSIMTKTPLWRVLDGALLVAALMSLYLVARSPRGTDPLFWPFAFVVLALISPLSWGYHYLPALAFSLALAERYSFRVSLLLIAVVYYPVSVVFLLNAPPGIDAAIWAQPLGTLAMALFGCFLWFGMRKRAIG